MIEQVVDAGVQKGELVAVQPEIFYLGASPYRSPDIPVVEPDGVWTPDIVADEFIRIVESGCLRHEMLRKLTRRA
jgi:hypothetical protein